MALELKERGRARGGSLLGRILLLAALSLPAVGRLPSAAAQSGDFLGEYKRGLAAYEDGRWREAVEALELAVARRPEAKARLPKKLYLKPYLPHFYLGGAYFRLGDCRRAIASWNESERQGVILGQPQADELQKRRALCSETLDAHGRVLAETELAMEDARRAFAAVTELSSQRALRPFWTQGSPTMAEQRRRAEKRLSDAERRLETGRDRLSSFAPLHQAASIAKEARYLFQAILNEAEAYRRGQGRKVDRKLQGVDALKRECRRALQEAAALPADSPALREQRQRLRGALDRVTRQGQQVSARDRRLLGEALSTLQKTLEAPPDPLQDAAGSFLRGNYREVLVSLVGELPEDPRTAAHHLLLRAAAAFALHRSTPGGNPVLRDQARIDLLAAAPHLHAPPGDRVFSPAFRAFFEEATAGAVGPPSASEGTETP